jgi:hypothetical protein
MAKKEFYSFLSVLTILIILCGCAATTIQSYQPKSPEEMQIKELILKWESTWNNHDVPGNLALWNDKAQIMYGSNRQIVSKKEYTSILPERMRAIPSLIVKIDAIKVSGNTAEASSSLATFYLIKENDRWSIMNWKY